MYEASFPGCIFQATVYQKNYIIGFLAAGCVFPESPLVLDLKALYLCTGIGDGQDILRYLILGRLMRPFALTALVNGGTQVIMVSILLACGKQASPLGPLKAGKRDRQVVLRISGFAIS